MTITTKSRKAKGRNLQNHVRDKILERFPWLGKDDCGSRSMGAAGTDLIASPLARNTLPLSIECKKWKRTPSRKELQQSKDNAYENTTAALVWCPHGYGPNKSVIMFDFEEFLDFYEEVASAHLTALENDFYEKNAT